MELCHGAIVVGSIRKGRAPRGRVLCELPVELSPAYQAFIGFVVLMLWNRAAASSGAPAVAASRWASAVRTRLRNGLEP